MSEIEIIWFSGKGKGGQHRNKHQNCCRIIHKTTGISAVGQRHRSRERNLKEALQFLATKLKAYLSEKEDGRDKRRNERIRTYYVEKSLLIDHESGIKITCKPTEDVEAFNKAIIGRKLALIEKEQEIYKSKKKN